MLFRTHLFVALSFLGCNVYDPSLLGGAGGESSSGNGGQGGSDTASSTTSTGGVAGTSTTSTSGTAGGAGGTSSTTTGTMQTGGTAGAGGAGGTGDAGALDARADDPAIPAEPSNDAAHVDAGPHRVLQFDGVDDYVGAGVQTIPADFTLEAWIDPMGTGLPEEMIVDQDRSHQAQGQFRLALLTASAGMPAQLYFEMSDASGSDYGLSIGSAMRHLITPAMIERNQWTHVAVTKSGADFTLVVNGAPVTTYSTSSAFSYGGPAVEFRIAARTAPTGTGPEFNFKGAIAEVRLWSAARTAAQISAQMHQTVTSSDLDWPTLSLCWRLDEGTGNSTRDAKGGGVALLVGGPVWVPDTPF